MWEHLGHLLVFKWIIGKWGITVVEIKFETWKKRNLKKTYITWIKGVSNRRLLYHFSIVIEYGIRIWLYLSTPLPHPDRDPWQWRIQGGARGPGPPHGPKIFLILTILFQNLRLPAQMSILSINYADITRSEASFSAFGAIFSFFLTFGLKSAIFGTQFLPRNTSDRHFQRSCKNKSRGEDPQTPR